MDGSVGRPEISRPQVRCPISADVDTLVLHSVQAYLRKRQLSERPSEEEKSAWRWFWETYRPLLSHFALKFHLPHHEKEDCLQDAWREILKSLPLFTAETTEARLRSWLHRIVCSKASDLLRRRARYTTIPLESLAQGLACKRHDNPATNYERHYQDDAVLQAMDHLREIVAEPNWAAPLFKLGKQV